MKKSTKNNTTSAKKKRPRTRRATTPCSVVGCLAFPRTGMHALARSCMPSFTHVAIPASSRQQPVSCPRPLRAGLRLVLVGFPPPPRSTALHSVKHTKSCLRSAATQQSRAACRCAPPEQHLHVKVSLSPSPSLPLLSLTLLFSLHST